MAENSGQIDIPKRALFRAAEVCELLKVQPYVLRTWESEFPELGVAKASGGPRVYRRADVEQVMRIQHLLLVEGLTLAGARRRLEEEAAPVAAGTPIEELMGRNARDRLTQVKRGLHAILELLAARDHGSDRPMAAQTVSASRRSAARGRVEKSKTAGRRAPVRRKRSS
jgi:DNA-binding transcriptional MerR regulator